MAWYNDAWNWSSNQFDRLPDDPMGTPFIQGTDNPFKMAENGGPKVGPDQADLSLLNQSAGDAKALEGQFIQQMGNQQATPGLGFSGSAPVVAAPSSAPPPASAAPAGPPQAMQMQAAQQQGGAPPPAAVPPQNNPGPPVYQGHAQPPAPTTSPSGPIAPIARSGPGHFTQGDPSITGAAVPGSTIGPANPVAAPPDADRPLAAAGAAGGAPLAPGMVAASMQAAQMQAGPAMQAAQLDAAQQEQFRQGQMGLAGSLQDTIAGRGTSVAQLQQQQAFAQQQAQQMGMAAAMGRGGNAALAMRTAAGNMGQLGAQQAAASAMQRAQETAIAQGQLGNVLNAGRGADIGVAGQNAQLSQQAGMANNANAWGMNQQNAQFQQAGNAQNAALLQQANANNQQSQLGFRGQNIQEQSNRANQSLQANKNMVDAAVGAANANAANAKQKNDFNSSALGAIATMSDRRIKSDISDAGSDEFREFLSALRPSNFRYTGSAKSEVGVMAQDVEKSRVGAKLVRETPRGKAIDVPRATTALMAALSDVHKRLTAVEGSKAA